MAKAKSNKLTIATDKKVEDWVSDRVVTPQVEQTRKLSAVIPASLYNQFKLETVKRGTTLTDAITKMVCEYCRQS